MATWGACAPRRRQRIPARSQLMPTILCLAVLLASASLGAAAAQDDEHDLLDVAVGGDHDFEELSPPADPAGDELDMAKVMAEERSYFLKHDADGDGALDRDEFVRHWVEATERNAAGGVDEAGEAGHAKDGSIDAKEREESGFAFTEFDKDKDAKVSWDEWAALMSSPTLDGTLWFHEDPQQPGFRDGAPEEGYEAAHLERLFRNSDLDQDDHLSKQEITDMLRRHSKDEEGGGGGLTFSNDEIDMVTWQLMDDKDGDKDGKMTLDEWLAGGGFLIPPGQRDEDHFLNA